MRSRILVVLTLPLTLALALALAAGLTPAEASHSTLPSKKRWLADVSTAMNGSQAFLKERVAAREPGERLAVVLDIDNTSLATKYARGKAILRVLNFTRYAHQRGIGVLFNTGRGPDEGAASARRTLRRVGYTVDGYCHRRKGERVAVGKQRCRAAFVAAGWTIVANVGNRSTDFTGGDYERAFMLPNYGNQLG